MPATTSPNRFTSFRVDPATLVLEPWPLERGQVVAGDPRVAGVVLDVSADGRVERGVWEHSPGASRDVEADELFVVVSGRATVEVEAGPDLELGPGDVGVFRSGQRTTWRVRETLRKVFQVTKPGGE